MGEMQVQPRACLAASALLLCSLFFVQPSQAFFGAEKAPVARGVVVPDYSPRPPPTPVAGSDDYMPRLPSEGAPSGGNAAAPAPAPAGTSTAFISSNPAAPLPAGVTDSATVLPMPTPGQEQRQVSNF